jgi:hypothetical protein
MDIGCEGAHYGLEEFPGHTTIFVIQSVDKSVPTPPKKNQKTSSADASHTNWLGNISKSCCDNAEG